MDDENDLEPHMNMNSVEEYLNVLNIRLQQLRSIGIEDPFDLEMDIMKIV